MRIAFLTLLAICMFFMSNAQLSTAKLFADHVVLQRNQAVPVWGWGEKKAKVTVDFNGQVLSVKADGQGNWKAVLKPMAAGGPYMMKITSGKDRLVYNDVMLGEVWLCSGQSNMEFQLKNAFGYKAEQKNAAQMTIRQFHVPDKISLTPEKDLDGGQWVKADTNTVGDFTAVGYFFAKKLSQALHVTVGLIHSSWGGTQVEDWISKDAMLASPELGAVAKSMPVTWDELKQRIDRQLKEYAYRNQPVVNYTPEQLSGEPASFFAAWQNGNVPGSWDWMGKLYSYRGQGFMQRTIKLDSAYANHSSVIRLGLTDADLAIYIDGKLVKKGNLPDNYQVDLPPGTWKGGDNSLLVQLMSPQKKPAWAGMGLTGAGNDLYVRFADTTINLADANWHTMPDLSKPYHFDFMPNNTAFMLYNSMINPLIPYAMAGVIWYQGEANVDRSYQYRTSFPLMITDWRNRWKQDFPFLFVQISSFGGFQSSNAGSGWAELREAQNLAYHLPGFSESPLFNSADFSGGYAIVSLSHAGNGLVAKDKYGYVKGFEVAGADHKFYYAQALITEDNKIKVWCSQVAQPIAVRYAWTDAPIDADLFTKDGMPVSAFRSDNWKGVTEGKGFE